MDKMLLTFNSEIKGIDEKEGTLTAYVSTGARDRMDEVLLPGGADMKNYKKNPIVLWAHDYTSPPIGKALWIKNDGDGIMAKIKFASTEFAQEILSLFKEGMLRAFSVGFVPKTWEDGDGEKKARRTYTKWEMLEFSAVPVPANPEALMLAVQKGLIKSDALKKDFNVEQPETVVDPSPGEQEQPAHNYMEDIKALTDDIDTLQTRIKLLEDLVEINKRENSDLRYRIYELIHKPDRPMPEISGEAVANIIGEAVTREVRRATGKVT